MTHVLLPVANVESAGNGGATAALLDRYLSDVRKLVSGDADPQLQASLRGELQGMVRGCDTEPELALPWLHLVITHVELAHCVSMDERAHAMASKLEPRRQLERVFGAAQELRQGSQRLQDALPCSSERGHAPGGRHHGAARAESTLGAAPTPQPQSAPSAPGSSGEQPGLGRGRTGPAPQPSPQDAPAPGRRIPFIEQKPRLPRQS